MKRLWAAAATLAMVVLVAVGAWVAGREAASPQQVELPDPPEQSPVAVPIEFRQLERSVISRGTPEFSDSQSVSLAEMETAGKGIVTDAPEVGDLIEEGDVLIEVDGRPVLALIGQRPAFRSMSVADAGLDVVQLQEALVRLGRDLEVDGVFGHSTEVAVIEMYVSAGYPPSLAGDISNGRVARATQLWLDVASDPSCVVPIDDEICSLFGDLVDVYRLSGRDVRIPFGEVLFSDELPVVIGSPDPKRGDSISSTTLSLAKQSLQIKTFVPNSDAQLVEVGAVATVDDEAAGIEIAGTVTDIRNAENGGVFGSSTLITVELSDAGHELVGRSMRVRIPVASTGTEVPVVPVSALRTDTGGSHWIQLLKDDDSTSWLEVRAGMEADGFVEVEPLQGNIPADAWVVVTDADPP